MDTVLPPLEYSGQAKYIPYAAEHSSKRANPRPQPTSEIGLGLYSPHAISKKIPDRGLVVTKEKVK
jgi:hypothetical protein